MTVKCPGWDYVRKLGDGGYSEGIYEIISQDQNLSGAMKVVSLYKIPSAKLSELQQFRVRKCKIESRTRNTHQT
ncbi:unnamed protein product [Moneuplotes crassus]|uniref:Uncharacterized protein n=1 Tax=Euplotes crassus TaxID=5936 RepID=A0AAD2D1J4_EUPCR|nr:unnamed protein product [Moneuplotes crassus]